MANLIEKSTGRVIQVGDIVESFRGESAKVLKLYEPHKPASEGHVETTIGYHYVGVYDLVWVDRDDGVA